MFRQHYIIQLLKNKLSSHKKMQKNLKCVLLRERNHFVNSKYHMILITWCSEKGKIMETVEVSVFDKDCEGRDE